MICRIWKGWTTRENSIKYEELFNREILPKVTKGVVGYKGVNLLKKHHELEVEFTTIFWFESMDAVIDFAGENYNLAVVPERVQKLMLRYEQIVQHHDVVPLS